MTRAAAIAIGLYLIGVVLGTASDTRPERPEIRRGEWRVLQGDFHAHSRFSDGFLSPPELVAQAERRGLDVLAVTEHNMVFPAKVARWWSELTGGPTIIIGEEITTRDYHIHAFGIEERISPMLTLSEVIDETHRQGGLAIAAHPVERFYAAFFSVLDRLDGTELMHSLSFRNRGSQPVGAPATRGGWSGEALVEFYEEALRRGKRLTAIGSSDYHFGGALGMPRTYLFTRGDSAADVMEALRAGRTVVIGPDKRLWGDPACVELLRNDPMPAETWDYTTSSSGVPDLLGRIVGLAGLFGLVALRRSRR